MNYDSATKQSQDSFKKGKAKQFGPGSRSNRPMGPEPVAQKSKKRATMARDIPDSLEK